MADLEMIAGRDPAAITPAEWLDLLRTVPDVTVPAEWCGQLAARLRNPDAPLTPELSDLLNQVASEHLAGGPGIDAIAGGISGS